MGHRPGEILDCIHARSGPDGCGSSKACSACGAVLTILGSQKQGKPTVGECLLTVSDGEYTESFEYRVKATPVRVREEDYSVVVLTDISGEKRREALERVFFHDILNTIGGLMGWSAMLKDLDDLDLRMAADKITILSERLIREVRGQRQLLEAERGNLEIYPDWVRVGDIFDTVRSVFLAHQSSKDKELEIDSHGSGETVKTDASITVRILTNMVKNALEAIPRGQRIRLWYERDGSQPAFHVWNPGSIPPEIQMRIFQRSFSTKGAGRGLGTYSMRLFAERYLKGKVSFVSTEKDGTTFTLTLPAAGR
jgi:signal transduction histidine kinase